MKKNVIQIQETINYKLGEFLKKHKIKHLRITSLGNSIATGYSIHRTTKPLLLRNESLINILKKFDITIDIYHFSRAQNNSDEHILEWIFTNVKQSEINKLNRYDFETNSNGLPNKISEEKINEYFA